MPLKTHYYSRNDQPGLFWTATILNACLTLVGLLVGAGGVLLILS